MIELSNTLINLQESSYLNYSYLLSRQAKRKSVGATTPFFPHEETAKNEIHICHHDFVKKRKNEGIFPTRYQSKPYDSQAVRWEYEMTYALNSCPAMEAISMGMRQRP